MEILVWAFLGGIVGAVLMGVTETFAAKIGITSGVNIALVGCWFPGLLHGRFAYSNILDSAPLPDEVKAGWRFRNHLGGSAFVSIPTCHKQPGTDHVSPKPSLPLN